MPKLLLKLSITAIVVIVAAGCSSSEQRNDATENASPKNTLYVYLEKDSTGIVRARTVCGENLSDVYLLEEERIVLHNTLECEAGLRFPGANPFNKGTNESFTTKGTRRLTIHRDARPNTGPKYANYDYEVVLLECADARTNDLSGPKVKVGEGGER